MVIVQRITYALGTLHTYNMFHGTQILKDEFIGIH